MVAAAEFFAGMGLVRAGLERCGVETIYANDIGEAKASLYRENWGDNELHVGDICDVSGRDIPRIEIATASFPCVDLSLAGYRAGLNGNRSGLVYEFCRVLGEMAELPGCVVIENVPGFLSANEGRDFANVKDKLAGLGYCVKHICIDAAAFVPQSRLRVFMIGFRGCEPDYLPSPPQPRRDMSLRTIAVDDDDAEWWGAHRLGAFLSSLSSIQAERVEKYQRQAEPGYYGAYRRTRNGCAVWEVRADEIAGALRTTAGGSGRQAILRAGANGLAARWMDAREYAALQGAEGLTWESVSPRQAMYAFGDAVCVPVIEWLANNCILPLSANQTHRSTTRCPRRCTADSPRP